MIPEYLYHYTSVDALALILKNHTIRLTPISKMDDPQEARNADIKTLGEFIFVSSWTEDSEESIPMWRLYTRPESGVRIKMKSNPFKRQGTLLSELKGEMRIPLSSENDVTERVDSLLDFTELTKKKIISPQALGGDILIKMEYTDDIKELEPKTLNIIGTQINVDCSKLGRVKSKYWSFQKEWRYWMQFMTFDMQGTVEEILASFTQSVGRLIVDKERPPFDYYDLRIDDLAYGDMEIMSSPNISAGNEEIIKLLVKEYNPRARIVDSRLRGNI